MPTIRRSHIAPPRNVTCPSTSYAVTATGTSSIIVTGVNDAPHAVEDELATTENTAIIISQSDLVNNDNDVDVNDVLRVVEIDSSVDISFVIVREVSKLEPPLINLHEGRSEGVIEMRAKIDFFGHDMSNNKVKAIGYLTIFFANYAD